MENFQLQNELGRSIKQENLLLKIEPFSGAVSYMALDKLFNLSPTVKVEIIQLPSLCSYHEEQLMSVVCLANLECSTIS